MSSNVLFLPCYRDGLDRASGSARIRCRWIAQNWPEADVYDGSQMFSRYCGFVFQKLYLTEEPRQWIKTLAQMRDAGQEIVLAFDLCDPDFLQREHERRMLDVLPLFDFAVATTEPIAEYLRQWLPTWVIPDRVDVAEVEQIGRHEPTDTDAPRFVWSGYDRHVPSLVPLLETINGIEGASLTVLQYDRPVSFDEFWSRVIEYDVLLNPRPDVPPFSYKSDNKTLIARAMGMPVARTPVEVLAACDPDERRKQIQKCRDDVLERWEIGRSVANWKKLLKAWGIE